ncbi:hypothetical protein GQ457_09G021970 [Hibiscus cannabinus]
MWSGKCIFTIEKQLVFDRVIVVIGTILSINKRCGLVNVYAPNDSNERCVFFDSLTDILKSLQTPFILGGDFNAVKMKEEKIGSTNDFNAMRKFAEFINCNNLVDLPMCGSSFTWFRSGTNISASKIDRFLVSPEICSWFPDASQYTLNRALSDHCPVLLKEGQRVATHRPFKWFNHWAEDPDFDKMIKEKFSSIKRKGIGEKLRLVKAAVKSWVAMARSKDVDTTDVLENKIATLERKIVAKGALPSEVSLRNTEIQSLKAQLWGKYRRDEREWLQKSRLKLFKEGDRNTNFFI